MNEYRRIAIMELEVIQLFPQTPWCDRILSQVMPNSYTMK